ncbi:MAG: 23S rRNA (guanosine(2251)-2'-O)-methyltransferase RlmB [Desulfobacteraceae bacterium]|nr:23S rRNA (guanosine(2251)-2'-O)-methyltransferase RlmB [Desulfobacteraceae bacterium]
MSGNVGTLLYGYHPVREALYARRRRLHTVYLAKGKGEARRQEIAGLCQQAKVDVQWVEPRQLTDMVGHPQHQDVVAKAEVYPVSSLEEILAAAGAQPNAAWVLLLDQVVDPQNFGAIVRTAHCAGVQGIMLPKDHSAPPSPAASKASAGALEHMHIAYETNLVNTMKILKDHGYWIAGSDREGAQSVFEANLKGPLALVIGSEEKGLRPLVKKHCDFMISIPQVGSVGSLNASAAAAVIIYEAFRQRNDKIR